MGKLNLNREIVDDCRELAESIVHPVIVYNNRHSTVSIERAVLRLLGFKGEHELNGKSFPVVNLIADKIGREGLKNGSATTIAQIKKRYTSWDQAKMAAKIIQGDVDLSKLEDLSSDKMKVVLKPWIDTAIRHIDKMRHKKDEMKYKRSDNNKLLKYVMVGTGDVNQDIKHAEAAVKRGANVISVVRSTAQSLLDYVPEGATQDGFGGTFATQENFAIMGRFLQDLSQKQKKYIRFCHMSSGLCMPELSVLGAMEGLDYMINDSLYGILFRDLNVKRSLIDQHFSRMIIARAGITINTAEDNYLKVSDGHLNHHQVLVSQFLNECLAKKAGMRDDQIGLGHAYEMDPMAEDSIMHELAMAQLVREVFPRCPIKYMPPTRYKDGDVYFNQVLDGLYNMVGAMTGQTVMHLGLPVPSSRHSKIQHIHSAMKNAGFVFNGLRSAADEIQYLSNGKVMRQARQILDNTHKLLKRISEKTLFGALEDGSIINRERKRDGGKGFKGVFEKSRRYYNPFLEIVNTNHQGRR